MNREHSWSGSSLLLASALITAACAPEDIDDGSAMAADEAPQAYEAWPGAESALISRSQSGTAIRVCLTGDGVNGTTGPTYQGHITNAITAWLNGAAPVSTVALNGSGAISFTCSSPDVTVTLSAAAGRANAGSGFVNLFAGDGFNTVLHEFGHTFNLGDTYVEGVWTCEDGQPNSVMCGSGGIASTLQTDDIQGIQEIYCMRFPANCRNRWEANLNWCGHATGQLALGDFNGDGRDDMLCHDTTSGYKWIANASSSGTFAGTSWEADMNWCNHADGRLHVGDFNGDGRDDMLCHDIANGDKWVALASASGTFAGTSWESPMKWCNHATGQLLIGDFNGDGRDDMLCHDTSSGYKWVSLASSSGTFSGTSWEADLGWCNHATGRLFIGDFNGDGRDDMLCHDTANGYKWVSLASSSGSFGGTSWEADLNWCGHADGRLLVGDFNSDGRDDLVCHDVNDGKKWIAFAQNGGTFLGTSRSWSPTWCNHASGQFLVGDFNGGSSDFLCHDTQNGDKWVEFQP